MKRARVAVMTAAVLAVASIALAQAKPDFSGTWTPDTPAAAEGAGRGRGMAGPMTVTHKGDTLTIERTMGENKLTTTYKLDGTESVNKQTMGQMGEVEIKSMAKWDADKLVITEKRPGRDGAVMETTQTWSMKDGMLTIERTGGRGASTTTYKKS